MKKEFLTTVLKLAVCAAVTCAFGAIGTIMFRQISPHDVLLQVLDVVGFVTLTIACWIIFWQEGDCG